MDWKAGIKYRKWWPDSRGVSSGFRKTERRYPNYPHPRPELRVLMTGQSASGAWDTDFRSSSALGSKGSRTGLAFTSES